MSPAGSKKILLFTRFQVPLCFPIAPYPISVTAAPLPPRSPVHTVCPPAHLRSQYVEVTRAISSADELAFVPRRDSRVLRDPRNSGGEPVGAMVVAVESLALLLSETLS